VEADIDFHAVAVAAAAVGDVAVVHVLRVHVVVVCGVALVAFRGYQFFSVPR